jgi:hypothetical protein
VSSNFDNKPDAISVREGCTRDCFYPWDTIFIHADRSVRVCCISPIIDHIQADWDMEALANGPKFRRFRENFLLGRLAPECNECTIKPEIGLDDFRERLTRYLEQKISSRATFNLASSDQVQPESSLDRVRTLIHFARKRLGAVTAVLIRIGWGGQLRSAIARLRLADTSGPRRSAG